MVKVIVRLADENASTFEQFTQRMGSLFSNPQPPTRVIKTFQVPPTYFVLRQIAEQLLNSRGQSSSRYELLVQTDRALIFLTSEDWRRVCASHDKRKDIHVMLRVLPPTGAELAARTLTSMRAAYEGSDTVAFANCLDAVCTYIRTKPRNINRREHDYRTHIAAFKGAEDLLLAAGFKLAGEHLRLDIHSDMVEPFPKRQRGGIGCPQHISEEEDVLSKVEFVLAQVKSTLASQPKHLGKVDAITALSDSFRFNANIQNQFKELMTQYKFEAYLPVRGDGNCYYRAVLFTWLQQSFALGCLTALRHFQQSLEQQSSADAKLEESGAICNRALSEWIRMREDAYSEDDLRALSNRIYETFNDCLTGVDHAFIMCLRHCIADYLRKQAELPLDGGLTYAAWASSLDTSLPKYCEEDVLVMGKEASDIVQDACPKVLGVRVNIYMVNRDATQIITQSTSPATGPKLDVNVLFKPGHYDILIQRNSALALLFTGEIECMRAKQAHQIFELVHSFRGDFEKIFACLDKSLAEALTAQSRRLRSGEGTLRQTVETHLKKLERTTHHLEASRDSLWIASNGQSASPCTLPHLLPALNAFFNSAQRPMACAICGSEDDRSPFKTLSGNVSAHLCCLRDYWEENAFEYDRLFQIPPTSKTGTSWTQWTLEDLHDVIGTDDFQSRLAALRLAGERVEVAPAQFYCQICLEDHTVEGSLTLPCDHRFCKDGLRQFLEIGMQNSHLSKLKCPISDCQCYLACPEHIATLENCLSKQAFDRVLQWLAVKQNNIFECKEPGCGERVFCDAEDDKHDLRCSQGHRFCGMCELGPHPRSTCEEVRLQKNTAEINAQRRLVFENDGWRPCPLRCKHGGGYKESAECDHVTCLCEHQFCWACGVDRKVPLAHDNRWHKPSCPYYAGMCDDPPKREDRCPECAKLPEGQCCAFPKDDGYPESYLSLVSADGAQRAEQNRPRVEAAKACALQNINGCGEHTADEIYVVGGDVGHSSSACGNARHSYCYDCLWSFIRSQLIDGFVPACPGSQYPELHKHVGGCGGETHAVLESCDILGCNRCGLSCLTQTQAEQIMNGYFERHPEEPSQDLVSQLRLEQGQLSYAVGTGSGLAEGWVSRLMIDAYLRKSKRQMGNLIQCPDGHDVGLIHDGQNRLCCPQPSCKWHKNSFCASCNQIFHFNTSCGAVAEVTEEWMRWCRQGREDYLRNLANEDRRFQASMENFQARRSQHEKDVQLYEQSIAQMQADEAWKSEHCKRCPKCARVIQRTEGCSSMVCGKDYHGGNQQNGCGAKFSWESAPAYIPDNDHKAEVPKFDSQPPEETKLIRHQICDGVDKCCDICGEAICGPLITCINCPDFNACLKCDARVNLMSDGIATRGGEEHPPGHVFRVLTAA